MYKYLYTFVHLYTRIIFYGVNNCWIQRQNWVKMSNFDRALFITYVPYTTSLIKKDGRFVVTIIEFNFKFCSNYHSVK